MKPEVLAAIDGERAYQEHRWPGHQHTAAEWILIADKCLTDAKRLWVTGHGDNQALHELRQVAAVAVAGLEQCGCPLRGDPIEAPADGVLREAKIGPGRSAGPAFSAAATMGISDPIPTRQELLSQIFHDAVQLENPTQEDLRFRRLIQHELVLLLIGRARAESLADPILSEDLARKIISGAKPG